MRDEKTARTTLLRQIAQIQKLPLEALRERWRMLFGAEPPAYSRSFMARRLIYRLQEIQHGGLSHEANERIRDIAAQHHLDEMGTPPRRTSHRQGTPVIGTRLIREWNGGRYEVTVVPGGFEFDGRTYRSLTAITKVITGTHWNGPAFFGLRRNRDSRK